jgi:non-ribosomal peptide synthetase-like protein
MHWPEPALRAEHGTAWLGNPAMFLPNRQKPQGSFPESQLYYPSFTLRFVRLCFELVKLTLPLMLFAVLMLVQLADFKLLRLHFTSDVQFWFVWPLLYMGAGVVGLFVTLMVKWILIGKYVAGEHALFSSFVWRHDVVTALLESLAHPYFVSQLRGTPFISFWFRLLGAEIGSRVWLDSTAITEPDLVHLGDDVAIHADAQLQTHLFEDRVLKLSHLRVSHKCSIGHSAIVLYDAQMNDGSHLMPLSLLMKAETLPPFSTWQGVPAHQTHSIGAQAALIMQHSAEGEGEEEMAAYVAPTAAVNQV